MSSSASEFGRHVIGYVHDALEAGAKASELQTVIREICWDYYEAKNR